MARLDDATWLKIKVKFESTDADDIDPKTKKKLSIEYIAAEFGCTKGAISQKAKKDNWVRGKTKQTKQANISAISNLVEVTKQTKQELNEAEQPIFEQEVLAGAGLVGVAKPVANKFLRLADKIIDQVDEIIDNNPSGLHVKSQTDSGITYGRNTEFLKDLTPIMNPVNQILGIGKPDGPQTQVNIQNNNSATAIVEDVKKTVEDLKEMF